MLLNADAYSACSTGPNRRKDPDSDVVLLSLVERCTFFSGSMTCSILGALPVTGDVTALVETGDDGGVD